MFQDSSPKGFGDDSFNSENSANENRKPQRPKHPLDRDVVKPEIYRNRLVTRFNKPHYLKLKEERITALGLTSDDVHRLESGRTISPFSCLGSETPIRLIDLLFLSEPELRFVYYEASESRKLLHDYKQNYVERLESAKTSFERDNHQKQIRSTENIIAAILQLREHNKRSAEVLQGG